MRSAAECAIPLTIAFVTHEAGAVRMLDPSERRTCASLVSRERRSDWLAGGFAAKLAIARCSGISDCNRIVLRSRVDMPPAVLLLGTRGALQPLPIALSIAHCTG